MDDLFTQAVFTFLAWAFALARPFLGSWNMDLFRYCCILRLTVLSKGIYWNVVVSSPLPCPIIPILNVDCNHTIRKRIWLSAGMCIDVAVFPINDGLPACWK